MEQTKDIFKTAANKRQKVLDAISDIKALKKKQKDLYRAFYVAEEDLRDFMNSQKGHDYFFAMEHFGEVDTSEIFYKTRKRDT